MGHALAPLFGKRCETGPKGNAESAPYASVHINEQPMTNRLGAARLEVSDNAGDKSVIGAIARRCVFRIGQHAPRPFLERCPASPSENLSI